MKHRSHTPRGSFLPQPKFRPEIQGLRSLAVLLVVLYHVWFGRVSGGVDVFLFISAFLLSTSSLRKIQEGKPLRVVSYWLHVFQRLLPAAVTVIAGTLVAAYFIVAPSRWASLLDDAQAALFYRLNWRLAENAVDYYAQNASVKTPFQHFWSLSMQGQIFILWPLLFTLIAFLVSYLRLKVIPTALLIFGSVFVASLTFSVIETYSNQAYAYFDTRTRLWEFAAGTLLAMLLLIWQVPDRLKVPLGWLGIIGLVTCGWLLPVQQAFPGFLALWPLLSGAMVIAAGQTGSPYGADRLLGTKPLQKLGAISYCLYLVHWPLLILYTSYMGKEQAGLLDGSLIILASIGLAWLLHQGVEKPLRAWEKKPSRSLLAYLGLRAGRSEGFRHSAQVQAARRPLLVIAACLLLVGGPVSLAQGWVQGQYQQAKEYANLAGSPTYPGAQALKGLEVRKTNFPIPMERDDAWVDMSQTARCNDLPQLGIGDMNDPEAENYCYVYSYSEDPQAPVSLLIGDSHSQQTFSYLADSLEEEEGTIILMIKPWCRFTLPEYSRSADVQIANSACVDYNAKALEHVQNLAPDNLFMLSTRTFDGSPDEVAMKGLDEIADMVRGYGGQLVLMRDNPRYTVDMMICPQESPFADCSFDREQVLAAENPALDALGDKPGVYHLDMTDYYCPEGVCQALVGNVLVYMDNNHMTRQYGESMAPMAADQLEAQGWKLQAPLLSRPLLPLGGR